LEGWQERFREANNPGKRYFLKLSADTIREVNKKETNGLTWSRKAMIRCGLALGLDGHLKLDQLSKDLQDIVKKYLDDFSRKKDEESEADTISVCEPNP
jgi:hypothetical protein